MRKNPASLMRSLPWWLGLCLLALLFSQRSYARFLTPSPSTVASLSPRVTSNSTPLSGLYMLAKPAYAAVGVANFFGSTASVSSTLTGTMFRDSDNTAYYLDPAATGISLAVAGNVGIGTTSPNIENNTKALTISAGTSGDNISKLELQGSRTVDQNVFAGINFYHQNTQVAQVSSQRDTGADSGNLYFVTKATGVSAAERMRITAGGNVGIGTTSPGAKLDVAGTLTTSGSVTINTGTAPLTINGSSGSYNAINFANSGGVNLQIDANGNSEGNLRVVTNHPLTFYTNNTEKVRIDAAGNVGIANTNPGYKLDVTGDINYTGNIRKSGTIGIPQGDLKTTLGTEQSVSMDCVTGAGSDIYTNFDLGGGSYGFYPQLKTTLCGTTPTGAWGLVTLTSNNTGFNWTTYRPNIALAPHNQSGGTGTFLVYAQQRYIQASPPYFVDGYRMNWFIYFLWNKQTGFRRAGWSGEDPPYEYYDGETFQTHPHPFVDYYAKPVPAGSEIAVIDPTDVYEWINLAKVKKMSLLQYLNEQMEMDPAVITPPTSPTTGQPIKLPAPLVWRRLRPAAHPTANTMVPGTGLPYNPNDFAQGDLAEKFPVGSGPLMGPGDIVDIHARSTTDPNNILEKTQTPYSSRIAGVISSHPSLIANNQYEPDTPTVPLALSGQVPVNVSLINGTIKAGDSITSSDVPGLGMKATKAGPIVARAVSDFDGTGATYFAHKTDKGWQVTKDSCQTNETCSPAGQITGLVMNSWYDPDVYLTGTGDLNIVGQPDGSYVLKNNTNSLISRVGAFAEVAVANVKAGLINAKRIILDGVDVAKKLDELSTKLSAQQQEIDALKTEIEGLKK